MPEGKANEYLGFLQTEFLQKRRRGSSNRKNKCAVCHNIGHSGGDVEANEIDAYMISNVSEWVVCELVRIL